MQTAVNNTINALEALAGWAGEIVDSHGWTILFIVAPTSIGVALLAGFIL